MIKECLTNESKEKYQFLFGEISKLMNKDKNIIIAIDGSCGSGKSTLVDLMTELFECNVFHMDDFFLPFDMRKEERLKEPGGNVHYERFLDEVLILLQNTKSFSYRPFRCSNGEFGEAIHVKPKKLNIVEGVYSQHPYFQREYDYKIFLTVNSQVQRQRILKRSREKYNDFLEKWIPMENNYFSTFNIKSYCDIVIDTSDLF